MQTNVDAYRDLNQFLEKEVKLEKSAQRHPSQLPKVQGYEVSETEKDTCHLLLSVQVETKGPEVILTRQSGKDKVKVTFNVTNTVNASESDQGHDADASGQPASPVADGSSQASSQLKSRPTFTVDINRGGQTLSFLCSYLPDDYPEVPEQLAVDPELGKDESPTALEDFQIDEFAIHEGDWNDKVYSADCAVIDGELYDKLLNLLEEHGIGEGKSKTELDVIQISLSLSSWTITLDLLYTNFFLSSADASYYQPIQPFFSLFDRSE